MAAIWTRLEQRRVLQSLILFKLEGPNYISQFLHLDQLNVIYVAVG